MLGPTLKRMRFPIQSDYRTGTQTGFCPPTDVEATGIPVAGRGVDPRIGAAVGCEDVIELVAAPGPEVIVPGRRWNSSYVTV